MPDGSDAITIRLIDGLDGVGSSDWDACAGASNPFVSHAFLKALVDSGSAGSEASWAPRHLVAEDPSGRVIACAPLYLKSHSYGEYVFDHGRADAYERAGGRYYPKLQASVPFTPVTGPRLLVRPGDAQALAEAIGSVLTDPLLRHTIVQGSRKTADRYDIQHHLDRLLTLYRALASGEAVPQAIASDTGGADQTDGRQGHAPQFQKQS